MTFVVVFLAATIAISGLPFLVVRCIAQQLVATLDCDGAGMLQQVVSALGAFFGAPAFFVLPGAALLWILAGGGGNYRYSDDGSLHQLMSPCDGLEEGLVDDSRNLADLSAAGEKGTRRLLSSRAVVGAILISVWLILAGSLTFGLSVWVFVTKKK